MSGKRQSYEAGHRPKFMVVIDKTPECLRAVHFASRRAARTGSSMVMLAVVDPPDNFEWIGVGEAMIEEAREEAEKRLEAAAKEARDSAGVEPEQVIRIGDRPQAIIALIDEDEDISFLVLAAGFEQGRPRPAGLDARGKSGVELPDSHRDRARWLERRRDRRSGGVKAEPAAPRRSFEMRYRNLSDRRGAPLESPSPRSTSPSEPVRTIPSPVVGACPTARPALNRRRG